MEGQNNLPKLTLRPVETHINSNVFANHTSILSDKFRSKNDLLEYLTMKCKSLDLYLLYFHHKRACGCLDKIGVHSCSCKKFSKERRKLLRLDR